MWIFQKPTVKLHIFPCKLAWSYWQLIASLSRLEYVIFIGLTSKDLCDVWMIQCQSHLEAAEVDVIGTVDGVCNAVDVMGNWQK